MELRYRVSGMRCQGCVAKVSQAIRTIGGVASVTVTLDPPMALVQATEHLPAAVLASATRAVGDYKLDESEDAAPADQPSLLPLAVIVGYLVGGVAIRALIGGDRSAHTLMNNFMGGFFVLFSLFKMIDLAGFARGFAAYDVIASRSREYALAYPFVELALGVAYLTGAWRVPVNLVTVCLMAVGSVGVARVLFSGRSVRCACLGAALKLPMTQVTLAENALMGMMALVMLAG